MSIISSEKQLEETTKMEIPIAEPLNDFLYKGIIIGDPNTGKTTINNIYIRSELPKSYYEPTIGVDFGSKTYEIDNSIIKLYTWDTAGQEKYKSIIRSYFRDICVIFMVYDTTRRRTFENLKYWKQEIDRFNYCNHKDIEHPILLIGTKIDLDHKRQVSTSDGSEYARLNGFHFIEINTFKCNDALDKKVREIIKFIYSSKLLEHNCRGIKYFNPITSKYHNSSNTIQLTSTKRINQTSPRCCN